MLEISVSGYKSIANETSIRLKGLTILSGTNSSGKSSFMQPLLLIKQTLESNFETGSILLYGPNVKLTDSSQAFFHTSKNAHKSFIISITDHNGKAHPQADSYISAEYSHDKNIGLVCTKQTSYIGESESLVTVTRDSTHEEIANQINKGRADSFHSLMEHFKDNGSWKIRTKKCLIDINFDAGIQSFTIGMGATNLAERIGSSIIHIPGIRGNPERAYRISASDTRFAGSFEPYVASIIHNLKNSNTADNKIKFTELLTDINRLGLGSQLAAKKNQ